MTFLWPHLLWALLCVPAFLGLYLLLLRRKQKAAVRYASLAMVRDAMAAGGTLRRHVPATLFLLALALMLFAVARPAALVSLPSRHDVVILAMDVSGSMRATDVAPSRLAAAQAAAKAFVANQPRNTRIGVVAFAATATMVQPPTEHREDVLAAIDRFQLQRGTAVGSGLLIALKAIFPDVAFDLRSSNPRRDPARDKRAALFDDPDEPVKPPFKPVPPGSYPSAVIVLLTDGQTTTGPDPIESARIAAERGVRIYTVGVGTPGGETIRSDGWTVRVRLDEDTLKAIANITRGEYFYAGSAPDLKQIYEVLNTRFVMERKQMEVTAFVAAAAAVLAVVSASLSMLWFNRIL